MKTWIGLFVMLISSFANASDVTVPYKDLLGILETINIENVKFVGVVSSKEAIGVSNPTTIKLFISSEAACGGKTLVDNRNDMLSFFNIGSLRPHAQPGCPEGIIEYFWTPEDFSQEDGASILMEIKIGPKSVWNSDEERRVESYFKVSAKITIKDGKFPNGLGEGKYFEYSDVRVTEIF